MSCCTIPANLTAGETLTATFYAPAAVSTVMYIRGPSIGNPNGLPLSGGNWKITQDTFGYLPGTYSWQIWQTNVDGLQSILFEGKFDLAQSIASLPAGTDFRSVAAIMVSNIEAMMSGGPDGIGVPMEVKRYKINNRELERYSMAELLSLLSYWKKKLAAENAANRCKSPFGTMIKYRTIE